MLRVGAPGPNICKSRVARRSMDELLGLAKGMLADGRIVQQEAEYLLKWLEANYEIADRWPANVLLDRLTLFLEDGLLDRDEEKDLLDILRQFTGELPLHDAYAPAPTTLPLDQPPPPVEHEGRAFCFTGTFVFGPRKEVEAAAKELGAVIKRDVIKALDYLVIGSLATKDWIHANFGRKIEKAVKYKGQGASIKIVHEDHWAQFV